MTILEIVLTIELILLAAIAIVLLVALLERDRKPSGSYRERPFRIGMGTNAHAQEPPVNRFRNREYRGEAAYRAPRRQPAYGDPYEGTVYESGNLFGAAPRRNEYPGQQPGRPVYRNQRRTLITPGLADRTVIPAPHAAGSGNLFSRVPNWRVDFVEMSSGRRVSRRFRDHLVVGRMINAPMESGKLYLSMDATVSRSQFCLYVTEEGVMIENLSNVNVTKKNGYPVWKPVRLEEGDVLQLGRMRYRVHGITPAA